MLGLLYGPTLMFIHDYKSFDYYGPLLAKWCLCFFIYVLSRFVIGFLPRTKHLLILWLQSSHTLILKPKKIKSVNASTFSPSICQELMGPDALILVFWMLNFKPAFSLSSFTFKRGSLAPPCFLPLKWYHLHVWGYWHFSLHSWFWLILHPTQRFSWFTLHIN